MASAVRRRRRPLLRWVVVLLLPITPTKMCLRQLSGSTQLCAVGLYRGKGQYSWSTPPRATLTSTFSQHYTTVVVTGTQGGRLLFEFIMQW